MKKAILYTLGVYLILSALIGGGVLDAILFLIIAGVVPGTTQSIPADAMLLIWGVSAWLILVRLVIIPLIKFGYLAHKPLIEQAKPASATKFSRETTPRRRYNAVQSKTKSLKSAK